MVTELAITLLLALHLVCVNAAAGGPLVALWLDWRGARGDEAAAKAARYLADCSVLGLVAGALVGLVIGWLSWNAAYESLWLGPLRYKAQVAAIEAAFSLLLLFGWRVWLPGRAGGKQWAAALRGFVALLASTNLLYHFPALFAVAARLYDQGQTAGPTLRGAGFRELMRVGETPALIVHVALASVAVAGALLLGLAIAWQRRGEAKDAARLAVFGGRCALVPTLLQLPVGLWALAALAPQSQVQLLGGSATGILLFVAATVAALWLTRELAGVAMGETSQATLARAIVSLVVTIVLMTAMQRQTRVQPAASAQPQTSQEIAP
jgi:hypothetical protein